MKRVKIYNEENALVESYLISPGLIVFVKGVLKLADEISRGDDINEN